MRRLGKSDVHPPLVDPFRQIGSSKQFAKSLLYIVDYLGLALWPTFWIIFYNHDYVINYCLDLGQFAGDTTGIAGISPPALARCHVFLTIFPNKNQWMEKLQGPLVDHWGGSRLGGCNMHHVLSLSFFVTAGCGSQDHLEGIHGIHGEMNWENDIPRMIVGYNFVMNKCLFGV